MNAVYAVSDNIISGLGPTTTENFRAVLHGRSAVSCREAGDLSAVPFYAALTDDRFFSLGATTTDSQFSRFERLVIASVQDALSATDVRLDDPETIFILSTTKGNIDLLKPGSERHPGLLLYPTAQRIAAFFGHTGTPVVVDHACASGVSALLLGSRLLAAGKYRHAVVTGADLLTRFVLSGFQAFQAISLGPCRPFDADRSGLNLGEACGTVVLSTDMGRSAHPTAITIGQGASSNDANHISGPSRTGEELSMAIDRVLTRAGLRPADIGFISAHGTATMYNDEMESKAFARSGLNAVPVNSLKGYFGHTLGAAGLIESVISMAGLRENTVVPTLGFERHGVSGDISVCKETIRKPLDICLKTSSGFGGCNAVILLQKH